MGSAEQYMITVKAFISDSHNISCCRLWVQRWALKDVLAKSFLIKTLCLLQTICQKLINTVSYKNTVNNASALQKSRVLTAITSDLSEAPTKLQLETNHFLFSGLFSAFTKLTVILQTSQYGQSYKHQLITVTNWHDATYSSAHWTFFFVAVTHLATTQSISNFTLKLSESHQMQHLTWPKSQFARNSCNSKLPPVTAACLLTLSVVLW